LAKTAAVTYFTAKRG